MKLNSMKDLYIEQLSDLYSAETQIIDALPKMQHAASSDDLKDVFKSHLERTREHKQRLEQIFSGMGMSPQNKLCKGMQGVIQEGDEVINAMGDPAIKDAALITAAQRVEHYEMAGYGAVRNYADLLGFDDASDLLQETLDEEGEADKKLTSLATGSLFSTGINKEATRR